MRSSIRIQDCLACIRGDGGTEEQRAVLRERILRELHREILRLNNKRGGERGRIVVHMLPRRFQLYGQLRVFTESGEGGYRLALPVESWVVSDRNLPRNNVSVLIE
jgi:hypothetical protein